MASSLAFQAAEVPLTSALSRMALSPSPLKNRLVMEPYGPVPMVQSPARRFPYINGPAIVEAPHEIGLTLERRRPGAEPNTAAVVQTVRVLPGETVSELKMRLYDTKKPWFDNNASLVLGNRELKENEVVSQLSNGEDGSVVHLYVRLNDVVSVEVRTQTVKDLSFSFRNSSSNLPRSALTSSLEEVEVESDNSLKLRGMVVDGDAALDKAVAKLGRSDDAVVHLVIRRDAKVAWRATSNDQFELSITTAETADSVKRKIEAHNGLAADSHKLVYNGRVLSASKSLSEYGIQTGAVLELVPVLSGNMSPCPTLPTELPKGSPSLSSPEHELFEDFMRARAGLANGHKPKLAPSGTGGSYFICDEQGHNVAVFKPEDEEPNAINNPKGRNGGSPDSEGLRHGVMPGEGAIREVAAFVLDHGHFAGVPPTAMVSCKPADAPGIGGGAPPALASLQQQGAKVGSLQQYVDAEGDCEERGPSAFPVDQVHKICVLDIRLANTDRNGGNILVRRRAAAGRLDGKAVRRDVKHVTPGGGGGETSMWELIPIDHGYCLPSSLEDISFEWLYWPQAKVPFSAATREYIASLSWEKDLAVLAANGLALRLECARVLKACTTLLKLGAARGLTPFEIGSMMCREDELEESVLETLHARAIDSALRDVGHSAAFFPLRSGREPGCDDALYIKHFTAVLEEHLDECLLEGVGLALA